MKRKRVIERLESLIDNSKDFAKYDEDGKNGIWEHDIKALKIAIRAVKKAGRYKQLLKEAIKFIDKLCVENKNLKREVVFHMKAAVEYERELNKMVECIEGGELNGKKS